MGQKPDNILPFRGKKIAQSPGSASIIDVSASSEDRSPAFLEPDLRLAVTRIILNGTYRETKHSAKHRSYRNVTDDDIQSMLLGPWVLKAAPEWDDKHKNWKYPLAGKDIDGDELVLVVALNMEEQMITVITKF